jgi:hypothetical protein
LAAILVEIFDVVPFLFVCLLTFFDNIFISKEIFETNMIIVQSVNYILHVLLEKGGGAFHLFENKIGFIVMNH